LEEALCRSEFGGRQAEEERRGRRKEGEEEGRGGKLVDSVNCDTITSSRSA
jgi:hypothetical protein